MRESEEISWKMGLKSPLSGVPHPRKELLNGLDHLVADPGVPPQASIRCPNCGETQSVRLVDLSRAEMGCKNCNALLGFAPGSAALRALVALFTYEAQYLTKEAPEKATALLREVLHVDDWNADAHNLLATVLDEAGEGREALGHFERAATLDPERSKFHYEFGVCLKGLNLIDRARSEYEKALALNPDHIKAIRSLADCYVQLNQWLAAEIVTLRLMQMDPLGDFFKAAVAIRATLWAMIWTKPDTYRDIVSDALAKYLPGVRAKQYFAELFLKPGGQIMLFQGAFLLHREGKLEESATGYQGLLVNLDDGPARNLVNQYYAANRLEANEHREAYEALQVAAELPCVKALVAPVVMAADDPALECELKERYVRLIGTELGIELENPRISRKCVSPEQMRDTYERLSLPLSKNLCEKYGVTRDYRFPDDRLVPGAVVWEFEADSRAGSIMAWRAGYVLRIKLPDGKIIEILMGETVGHQLAEW